MDSLHFVRILPMCPSRIVDEALLAPLFLPGAVPVGPQAEVLQLIGIAAGIPVSLDSIT